MLFILFLKCNINEIKKDPANTFNYDKNISFNEKVQILQEYLSGLQFHLVKTKSLEKIKALAIGMGWGNGKDNEKILTYILEEKYDMAKEKIKDYKELMEKEFNFKYTPLISEAKSKGEKIKMLNNMIEIKSKYLQD